MTRTDVLRLLKLRIAEIRQRLPLHWQRGAIIEAHIAAGALLQRLREQPEGQRSWR